MSRVEFENLKKNCLMDIYTKKKRSEIMARVRQKNTVPELVVRRLLHSWGFRYRLHVTNLPGCPDIVMPRHRKIIFVHGCFWHGHPRCKRASLPLTNKKFWREKIEGNKKRDRLIVRRLRHSGWQVLTVWQCQIGKPTLFENKLKKFLGL